MGESKKQNLQEFARYTFLSVLGTLGVSCYILADTFFVAQGTGSTGLAALNLAIPVYNFIHGTGLMLGMGGATLFSIAKIRGDQEQADKEYSHVIGLALLFSMIFMAVGLFASKQLTACLQADGNVFEMTRTYLFWLLLFSPAFLLNDIFLCFIRNDGEPKLPMFAMLIGSFSNVVLDYIFIFPFGWGIFGAVFATGLSPLISIGVMLPYFIKKRQGFHLRAVPPQAEIVKNSLLVGFPSLIAQISAGIVMIVFNLIILRLEGNVGVAAYGVIANISLVVAAIYTGIAQGMQPLVSEAYGAGEKKRSREILRYGMVSMAAVSVVLYAVLFFGADSVAEVFNKEKNPALQSIAVEGLKIYFLSNLFVGYNIIAAIYFSSVEQVIPAHVISLLRGFIFMLPMVFLLGNFFGMKGVWMAYPAAEGLTAAVGVVYFFCAQRRTELTNKKDR